MVTDDRESVLIVDIPNHEVVLDEIKHNYLTNKTFSLVDNDWVEVSDVVEIPDWDLLNLSKRRSYCTPLTSSLATGALNV